MSKKSRIMVVLTATIILVNHIMVYAEDVSLKSQGKIVFTNDTSDTSDDVIFDASDFEKLYNVCE